MHIPDGYLSPSTCIAGYVAMIPFWAIAVKKVKKSLDSRLIPLMVIGAAFSFVIMMFNIPIPGGTTAHAVGGGILAVILGPWAASVCISIALAIQALMFGDGGIFAFGFNCLNMAIVLPFTTHFIYQAFAGRSDATSAKRWIWSAVGGYFGITFAAVCVGLELGIQPALFHTVDGAPLYSPYTVSVAVPAMLFAHLLIAGPVEGIVTGAITRYFQTYDSAVVSRHQISSSDRHFKKLWYAIAALIVLCPLGLLATGTAFGEGSTDDVKEAFGFVPSGLASIADHYQAFLQDYSINGFGGTNPGFWHQSVGYYAAALLGIAVIAGITVLISRMIVRRQVDNIQ